MTVQRGITAVNQVITDSAPKEETMTFLSATDTKRYVAFPSNVLDMLTPVKVVNVYPKIMTNEYQAGNLYDQVFQQMDETFKQAKANGASEKDLKTAKDNRYAWSPKEEFLFEVMNLETGKPIVLIQPKGADGIKVNNFIRTVTEKVLPKASRKVFEVERNTGRTFTITALDEEDIPEAIRSTVLANFEEFKEWTIEDDGEVIDGALAKHDEAFQLESLKEQGINIEGLNVSPQAESVESETKLDLVDDDLPF